MLLEQILVVWFTTYISTTTAQSTENLNPMEENPANDEERKIQKRQYPWALPQAFPNLIYYPYQRESWRYYPCRSYPSFPSYLPSQPSLPPSTPPSSPADDPNDILDRMAGGEGKKNKNEPSRCVWAVVACCSPGSRDIRYSCFELLGCPGAFWDVNPCEEKVVMAAANSALNFYSGKNSTETTTTTEAPN